MIAVETINSGPAPRGAGLGDHIAALCAQITLSEHALLTALREFEAGSEWVNQGALSCAQWLSWRVGMGPEASRERIRVARALGSLRKIDEAFGAARISYSKVRALTRVATLENEELLLEIARGATAAQLERICRKFRGYLQDEQPAAAELKRRVSVRYGDDGTMRFSIVLAADEGSRLLAAIESGRAALDEDGADVSAESSAEPNPAQGVRATEGDMTVAKAGASRAEGLMAVVESWFANGPQPRRGGAPHEVVLHVSPEGLSLAGVAVETSEDQATPNFIETAGGGAVSTQTARGRNLSESLGHFQSFRILDPKPRLIHTPCFRERVLHHGLMVQMGPILDRSLISDTVACRPGKRTLAPVRRAQHHARRSPFYVKVDMRSYFDSVNHYTLETRLARRFKKTRAA